MRSVRSAPPRSHASHSEAATEEVQKKRQRRLSKILQTDLVNTRSRVAVRLREGIEIFRPGPEREFFLLGLVPRQAGHTFVFSAPEDRFDQTQPSVMALERFGVRLF
jgi:hypothetical protein